MKWHIDLPLDVAMFLIAGLIALAMGVHGIGVVLIIVAIILAL